VGVNNIPPKVCSYSCPYCEFGRTVKMQIERQTFYDPEDILKEVEEKMAQAARAGEAIDYLTFVPDGEPRTERLVPGVHRVDRPLVLMRSQIGE